MTIVRRELLIGSLAGLAAVACGDKQGRAPSVDPVTPPPKPSPKRLLILGGTGFLGPHLGSGIARDKEAKVLAAWKARG